MTIDFMSSPSTFSPRVPGMSTFLLEITVKSMIRVTQPDNDSAAKITASGTNLRGIISHLPMTAPERRSLR